MSVTVEEFIDAFSEKNHQAAYQRLVVQTKKACNDLQDAITRAGEAIGSPFQDELDDWQTQIDKIDAGASADYFQAMYDLDAMGIPKKAANQAEIVFETGRKIYQEKRSRAEKAVLRFRAEVSNLPSPANGRFKPMTDQLIASFKAAETLRASDFPESLAAFDRLAGAVQQAWQAIEKDEEVEAFHQLPSDAQQQKYQTALDGAAAAIAACNDDPFKKPVVAQMLFDMKAAAKRGNFKNAFAIVQDVMELAADQDYAKQAAKSMGAIKPDEKTVARWKEEEEAWKAKCDFEKYSGVKPLGQGASGIAMLMENKEDKNAPPLVMKIMLEGTEERKEENIRQEAGIFEYVGSHPNIVRSLGVQEFVTKNDKGGDDRQKVLVLEGLSGGSMTQNIKKMANLRKSGEISEEEYWGMMQFSFRKSMEALAFMQGKGVAHGDIKPDNIAFDHLTGEPKLIDLGGVSYIEDDHSGGGTPAFLPAEADTREDRSRDAFAIGASAFEIADGNTMGIYEPKKGKLHGQINPNTLDMAQSDPSSDNVRNRPRDKEEVYVDNVSTEVMKGGAPEMETYQQARTQQAKDENGQPLFEADGSPKLEIVHDEKTRQSYRREKKHGEYGAETAYVDFLQWLMNDTAGKRPTPAEALRHPFLQDAMLDDDAARESLLKVVNPELAKQRAEEKKQAQAKQAEDLQREMDAKTEKAKELAREKEEEEVRQKQIETLRAQRTSRRR